MVGFERGSVGLIVGGIVCSLLESNIRILKILDRSGFALGGE